ncbi:hypothetical protein Hanom_Chr11g01052601 [Helianthus anomalus]
MLDICHYSMIRSIPMFTTCYLSHVQLLFRSAKTNSATLLTRSWETRFRPISMTWLYPNQD